MAGIICYDSFGDTVERIYQWDLNRKIKVEDAEVHDGAAVSFHFTNRRRSNALVVQAVQDGSGYTADIPNELTSEPDTIDMYIYEKIGDAPEQITTEAIRIPIVPRSKPDDYIYTPTSTVLVADGLVYEDGVLYLAAGDMKIGTGVPISSNSANVYRGALYAGVSQNGIAVLAHDFEEVQ